MGRREKDESAQDPNQYLPPPTFVHYPEDPEVSALEYQFMVGTGLMVAPVLDPDTATVRIYLPAGNWVHLWTGETHGSSVRGVYETVPIGEPAVFNREDSAEGTRFRQEQGRLGLLRAKGG